MQNYIISAQGDPFSSAVPYKISVGLSHKAK